jgi:hypothetical protein
MQGYDVVTVDDQKIGHIVDMDGDYLIVEHGLLHTKHALPRTFAEVDEDAKVVRTTLSKNIVHDSPKVNGEVDRAAIAEHYGLAEGYEDPPTRGLGEILPDDPALPADDSATVQDRVRIREGLASGHGNLDRGESPGFTGGDRYKDYPRD